MGVSKNKGTPKWMVKIMENPIKMDDLGGNTTIFGNTHIQQTTRCRTGHCSNDCHVPESQSPAFGWEWNGNNGPLGPE